MSTGGLLSSLSSSNWVFKSPDDNLPGDNHRAFRSITLLTSKVQHKSDTTPSKEENANYRSMLSLSVAFSILAALQNEVVAVMAKVVVDGELQAVTDFLEDLIGKQRLSVSLLASRNARKQDRRENKNVYPTIITSEPLPSLSRNATVQELDGYVQGLCTNERPSSNYDYLHHHLDVLRQLLLLKVNNASSSTLSYMGKLTFRYVVAVAYRKMHSRIYFHGRRQKRPQSQSMLKDLTIPWSSLRRGRSADSDDPRSANSDDPRQQMDRDFLIYLATFPEPFCSRYPELQKLGMAAKERKEGTLTDWSEGLHLYTEATAQEFHGLFVECLDGFVNGLRALDDIRQDPTKHRQDEFRNNVIDIVTYACCLRPLIRSHALQRHIIALLSRKPSSPLTDQEVPDDDDEDRGEEVLRGDDVEPLGGDDVEPLETDPGVSPVVKPYRDWLKLITAEFDAANHLFQFFVAKRRSKFTNISIEVLTPSYTSRHSLAWAPLFQSFVPDPTVSVEEDISNTNLNVSNTNISNPNLSNTDILNYLTTIKASISPASRWLNQLKSHRTSKAVDEMTKLIRNEEPMSAYLKEMSSGGGGAPWQGGAHGKQKPVQAGTGSWWRAWLVEGSQQMNMLPDWPPLVAEILGLLEGHESVTGKALTSSLDSLFSRLNTSLRFFEEIAKTDSDMDESSSCRIHCEACLASLIFPKATQDIKANDDYQVLLKKLANFSKVSIIGVSKRCCPTCSRLLVDLAPYGVKIIRRGDHSTISPCSLPAWLPDSFVAGMNAHFGPFLREELVRLITCPGSLYKNSANSGGSAGRSSDGEEDDISIH